MDLPKKAVEIQATISSVYVSRRLGEKGSNRLLVGARYWDLNLTAGYRYLHVDQEQKADFDTDVYSPLIGLRFTLRS